MMYSLQAGFVPEYGRKLNALEGDLSGGNFRGGAATATKNAELGVLCLPIVGDSLSGRGLERQEWDFLDDAGTAGASWRFQQTGRLSVCSRPAWST